MSYNNHMNNDDLQEDIRDKNIIRSGHLDVGDGHEIYWVDWGNKDIDEPIFYLHGGPGGGFNEGNFSIFDPKKHRVVFHDQRGSGRSTPFASIKNNTSQDLVSDITKLKNTLGFKKISVYGFSWGSTLALLYAITNPSLVTKMLIGGIFLARKVDRGFYLNGQISSHFPEVWESFANQVPEKESGDIAGYFKKKLFESTDEDERALFARHWMLYERSISVLDYVPKNVERGMKDFASSSLAYLEAHYLLNDCFIEENYILNNVYKLDDIPTVIVHGRYDFICRPSAAYDLKKALSDSTILHFVTAGHSRDDTVQREVIKAYINMLWSV